MTRHAPVRLGLVLCLMAGAGAAPVLAQNDDLDVDPVMAAFVHRFMQFVEWPQAVLAGTDQISICVAGPEEFAGLLASTVASSRLNGRAIATRRVVSPATIDGCHLLFVSAIVDHESAYIGAADRQPILTVGDSPEFLDAGGIIGLRIVESRIRFAVNADAAARAGLRLSSQLLGLALEVRGGGG